MGNEINLIEQNNKKIYNIVLIIVIIVLLLVIGVVYFLQNQKIKNLQSRHNNEIANLKQQILDNKKKFNSEINKYTRQIKKYEKEIAENNNNNSLTNIKPDVSEQESELITEGYRVKYKYIKNSKGGVSPSKLLFVSPAGEEYVVPDEIAIKIDGIIKRAKTGKNKNLTIKNSGVMPIDPSDKNLIYFSTSLINTASNTRLVTNRIYSYNLKNKTLTELYKEESNSNSPTANQRQIMPSGRTLTTAGISGNKIVLLADDPDNSPGPCTKIWYHYQNNFLYLDINDTKKLYQYNVPQKIINKAKEEAEKCKLSL